MRILVFSDTHGTTDQLNIITAACRPDLLLHLGDGLADLSAIDCLPDHASIRTVRGNNDFAVKAVESAAFSVGKHKIFMTHGHFYSVKNSYFALLQKALNEGADIVLFGHTHMSVNRYEGDTLLFNPGAYSRFALNGGKYGLLDFAEDGRYSARIIDIKETPPYA